MLLVAVSTTLALAVPGPSSTPLCDGLSQLSLARQRMAVSPAAGPPAPVVTLPDGKMLRTPRDSPNIFLSDNFALQFGEEGDVTDAEALRLLADFERAWTVHVDELDGRPPLYSDTHRVNVFLSGTGDGGAFDTGASGSYSIDWDGFPQLVVKAEVLDDPDRAAAVAYHELYHAIQDAEARFPYLYDAAWFWEATAEWAAIAVDPDNPSTGSLLFGYLLQPELPVNDFTYPTSLQDPTLDNYHQYGAFLFPLYLSEAVDDPELIPEVWRSASADDPLEALREALAERGRDLDRQWLNHIARNVVFDYDQGERWAQEVAAQAEYWEVDPVLRTWEGEGPDSWKKVGPRAPLRYGYNAIRLLAPEAGDLLVRVKGDAEGTEGSEATHGARVIVVRDGTPDYRRVPFEGREGELLVEEIGGADEVWLVVGAWTAEGDLEVEERFPYRYVLQRIPADEPQTEAPDDPPATTAAPSETSSSGLGCAVGGAGAAPWAMVLLAMRRRRRETMLTRRWEAPPGMVDAHRETGDSSCS